MRVKLADGREALTRDGNLHVDGEGRLVTSFGGLMSPNIQIPKGTPESKIAIGRAARCRCQGPAGSRVRHPAVRARNGAMSNRLETAPTRLGQIQGAVNENSRTPRTPTSPRR